MSITHDPNKANRDALTTAITLIQNQMSIIESRISEHDIEIDKLIKENKPEEIETEIGRKNKTRGEHKYHEKVINTLSGIHNIYCADKAEYHSYNGKTNLQYVKEDKKDEESA